MSEFMKVLNRKSINFHLQANLFALIMCKKTLSEHAPTRKGTDFPKCSQFPQCPGLNESPAILLGASLDFLEYKHNIKGIIFQILTASCYCVC